MEALRRIFMPLLAAAALSCGGGAPAIDERTDEEALISPDYKGATIPPNIAPLNFGLLADDSAGFCGGKAFAVFENGEGRSFNLPARGGFFDIPAEQWKEMLSPGGRITVTVVKRSEGKWKACRPFCFYVARDSVDGWMAYRYIEPSYGSWNVMGLYQRNLESFEEEAIYENTMTDFNCVNCHSFCNRDPGKMLFHIREKFAGTVIIDGDEIEMVNTKTGRFPALVYPYWHPSGDYVAFSVNKTFMAYPAGQRVEVYDTESDVVVYDVKGHRAVTSGAIYSKSSLETFPSFSPDGKTLYFCTARSLPMPDSVERAKYSLCTVSFDPADGTFGKAVDTLINAGLENVSVSYPRVSPDGRYLVCTLSAFGTFPIWHREADLYIMDLETGQGCYLDGANSGEADSYHSWSSNSRWLLFGSRRKDGLYTNPYIAYIDEGGRAGKAFVVPQKKRGFYGDCAKSFNLPEFITGKVGDKAYDISRLARSGKRASISFQ